MAPANDLHDPACPLCREDGGTLVWRDADWRVIRAAEADFPAFYRVICNRHVAEFSALDAAARVRCMDLVCTVEHVLIDALAPTKINLAQFGNMVPHLHWHVIARFDWDSHFPQPVWGTRQRDPQPPPLQRLALPPTALNERIRAALTLT